MSEEKSLIERAKKGENKAFGELYDEYMPRIYRFVFLKTGRKEDAEDITHKVFMNAWENIGKFEFRGFPFSSWLYRIAGNAVIDYYRTWKNNPSIEAVPEEAFSMTEETEMEIDLNIDLEIVKTAVNRLKDDEKDVILMKFVDDLTNDEIANILDKSEGAIRVIQHRALKQLRVLLRPFAK